MANHWEYKEGMDLDNSMSVLHSVLVDYFENNIRSDNQTQKEVENAWNEMCVFAMRGNLSLAEDRENRWDLPCN